MVGGTKFQLWKGTTHMDEHADPRDDIVVEERPWGNFKRFTLNQVGTVKVISVMPARRLSLQRHLHRSELWHILSGPVQVTVGDRTWDAQEDEEVWIPAETVHRIANAGTEVVRILEVGFGDFDEEDIVRLEDDYSREEEI